MYKLYWKRDKLRGTRKETYTLIIDEVFEIQLDLLSMLRNTNSTNIPWVVTLGASFPGSEGVRLSLK